MSFEDSDSLLEPQLPVAAATPDTLGAVLAELRLLRGEVSQLREMITEAARGNAEAIVHAITLAAERRERRQW